MVLASMVAHDATGGGVMAALSGGPSLNVPGIAGKDSILVGYSNTGISANEVTLTCAADDRWPVAGFSLKATSNGAAASYCKPIVWFDNPMPCRAGETITFTATSGANDNWVILYWDVEPFSFKKPTDDARAPAFKHTRTTAASGTNLTALTVQSGLVTLGSFGAHDYVIDSVTIGGAFTTSPIIGLKVDKPGWDYTIYIQLAETDVADLWVPTRWPAGCMPIRAGDTLNVSWLSDTAEQPTANITFKYPVGR